MTPEQLFDAADQIICPICHVGIEDDCNDVLHRGDGMSEVKTCCAAVYSGDTWHRRSKPCGKKAKFDRDGKHYCGTHDPVTRKAKQDASLEEFRRKCNARNEAHNAPFNRIKELELELSALRLKLEDLVDAADAVISNEEHAFSGGMTKYQKGSQTWQIYEDLRCAVKALRTLQKDGK
ncbi:MAG: hypothetical protein ACXU8A_00075 [Burkholderiaceae bacterium]